MYDMYPENWSSDTTARTAAATAQPRRRVRREHRVLPVITDGPGESRSTHLRSDVTR